MYNKVVSTKETRLKKYKGYNIDKVEDFDARNRKIATYYLVNDDDENNLNVLPTLIKAKEYIDMMY